MKSEFGKKSLSKCYKFQPKYVKTPNEGEKSGKCNRSVPLKMKLWYIYYRRSMEKIGFQRAKIKQKQSEEAKPKLWERNIKLNGQRKIQMVFKYQSDHSDHTSKVLKFQRLRREWNFSCFCQAIQLEWGFIKYFISLMIINQLLGKLEKIINNRELLRKTCKSNQLPITILNGFTNAKITLIYQRLLKHYEEHPDKAKSIWFENQLKIFFWIVICVSLFEDKKIKDFQDGQWLLIQDYFFKKELYTFEYEAKRVLTSGRKNSRVWNTEENKLLKKVMSDQTLKNKWNEVARILYAQSAHKYFRTGKQCREHWLNHLDPSKKHGKWADYEDQQILKYVFSNGKKWSLIAKDIMTHRTEHMIKNRYKALLFKEKKKMATNEYDQKRVLKKMIRRFGVSKAQPQVEDRKEECKKEPEVKFQTEMDIEACEKNVEKSVSINHGDGPLNNFNFSANYPWICIWAPTLQMMAPYNIYTPIYNQGLGGDEVSLIRIEQKSDDPRGFEEVRVKSLPSQETLINVSSQNIEE